jgi:hypothetical protein
MNFDEILAPCHPERREGSPASARESSGHQRSFAALRMTGLEIALYLSKFIIQKMIAKR